MSVTDGNGVGTELDIGNTRDIDDAEFLSSGYFRYMQRQIDLPVGHDGAFDYWRTSIGFTYAWPIR